MLHSNTLSYMSHDHFQIKNEECQKTSTLAGGFSFYSTFNCISGRGKQTVKYFTQNEDVKME
jgi:hypothetical protein